MEEDELRSLPILIFCNKIKNGVMSLPYLNEELGLHLIKGRHFYSQGTCAISGEGIMEGMEWLVHTMKMLYN